MIQNLIGELKNCILHAYFRNKTLVTTFYNTFSDESGNLTLSTLQKNTSLIRSTNTSTSSYLRIIECPIPIDRTYLSGWQ